MDKIVRRTKFSVDKIVRRTKFWHQVEISAVLSDEIFSSVSYFPIQFTRKICFNVRFVLIWHILNFNGQNISADKILGSKSDFRQFCLPKFCPIRYSTGNNDNIYRVRCDIKPTSR